MTSLGVSPLRADAREWRRRLIPAGTVALASAAMTLPLPLAWAVMPNGALLMVLIWASVQPRLMPMWAAFLLGLLHDVIVGTPFGLHGLLFPLTVLAVRLGEGRLEARSIAMDWLLAALLVLAVHGLSIVLLPVAGASAPLLPVIAQAMLTALAFPLALALAAMLHRRLVEQA